MALLQLRFGGYSTAGVKEENQDALAAYQPQGSALEYKGAVATIADGVSTSERAKEASNTCATTFIQDYLQTPETWSVERSAAHIIRSLNTWCYAQSGPQLEQTIVEEQPSYLTTFSSVVVRGNKAFVFHVGDSRVYRYQGSELEQLTRDHKQKQGKQTYLTRAIGIDPHIDVDLSTHEVEQNDLFLLSTDGLHDFLTQRDIANILSRSHISLEAKAQDLANEALKQGSDDNVSCLIVKVESLPDQGMEEVYQAISSLVIPPPMKVGNSIEGYKIQDVLFEGTRSHVYKVLCTKTKNTYALKAPSTHFQDDDIFLRGFMQEQWIGQRIEHENVMRILPRNPDSQLMYHVCELIEGQTLRQWMIDNPLPSLDKVRAVLGPVVSALRKMQRLDMVHRDLKPENIMINRDGKVKLVDFGTIRAASTEHLHEHEEVAQGSVNYVAPESVLSNVCDHSSDIFSLGVVVYEMLTNQLPYKPFAYKDYRPKSYAEWKYRSIHKTPAELPNWVDVVLRKATSPDPSERYDSYSEFLTDLTQPSESQLNAIKNAPLIERNPLLFWQLCAGVLLGLNVAQLIWRSL